MTDEEVVARLTAHDHEIGSLKHRMDVVEEHGKQIREIAMAVQKLSINMEQMLTAMTDQSERLKCLEGKPGKILGTVTQSALTTLVTAIVGGLVVVVIQSLANVIH